MNPAPNSRYRALLRVCVASLSVSLVFPLVQTAHAADGTWALPITGPASGSGSWNSEASWVGGIIADGSGSSAIFSTNISGTAANNNVITLDAARTIGSITFGDSDTSSAGTWNLSAGTGTPSLTLAGVASVTVNALGTNGFAQISANIAGSDGLTKGGAGRLVLTANNTYTGTTTISAGTLQLGADATSGSVSGNIVNNGTLRIQRSNTVTLAGDITGTGGVTISNGSGTVVLTGNNTYSGSTSVVGHLVLGTGTNNGIGTGTLTLSAGSVRSMDNNARTIANSLGAFTSNGFFFGAAQGATDGLGDLTFSASGSVNMGGSKNWAVNNATTVTFNNSWTGNNGWNFTKTGTGNLVFNGNVNSTGVGVVVSAGTMVLNGAANGYTGNTVVNGGTLLINGAKNGSGAVTVNSTGTFGGDGTVAGAAVANAGSFLSPGSVAGQAGTLTFGGALDISGLASEAGGLLFNLGATGSSDKIVLSTDALTIGSGVLNFDDFTFTALAGFGEGTYILFQTSTTIVGTLGSNLVGTIGGYDATLSLSDNNIVLNIAPIPEPSTYALLAGGAILGLALLRRRRD